MGKLTQKAMRFKLSRFRDDLENILTILKNTYEDEIPKEKIEEILTGHIDNLETIYSELVGERDAAPWDFSKEREENIFAEDEIVCLKYLSEEYKSEYIRLEKQIITMYPRDGKENEYWDQLWEDTRKDYEFDVAVIRKSDGVFLGYLGIKNTRNDLWEIAIEFLEEYTANGYGTRSMGLFMNRIAAITGKNEFQVKVEVDNVICQHMIAHHAARLVGIKKYCFSDEKLAEEFENENLDLIDDNMIAIAKQLNIEPKKLLSHVLEYRIKVE